VARPRFLLHGVPTLLWCLMLASPMARAGGDVTAGRIKAIAACNVCHGRYGVAVMPSAANLAGQAREYLVAQLQNFRNGRRQHEVMSVIAAQLKDGEIEDLAAWFSSIPVEVKEPAQ
jgi:cytochrome c553